MMGGGLLRPKGGKKQAAVATTATAAAQAPPKAEETAGGASAAAADQTLVPRPLRGAEREAAWRASNFYAASSGHELPVALWILGPSSVGKSTLTAQVGPRFGIPHQDNGGDQRGSLDAVYIDGEFIRDAHGVWQKWIQTPDWRSAYPALKSIINKEKDQMCAEAAANRQHLVIPQTLLNLQKGLDEVEALTWQGYVNFALAVVAPLADCEKRGRKREVSTGKRYQPLEYEQSISAIPPMIMACNGRYEVVHAVVREGSETMMDYHTLSSGPCGHRADHLHTGGIPFGEKELRDVIDAAIHNKPLPPLPVEDEDAALGLPPLDPEGRPTTPALRPSTACSLSQLEPSRMPRPFTSEECVLAWSAANFHRAASKEQPIALWIIGPSSVGKSTLTAQLGAKFEIPKRPCGEPAPAHPDAAAALDAVIVDGDRMRDAYGVWQLWMQSPERQFAYRALKSTINKEKGKMCTEAVAERKNLVIPKSMRNLKSGLNEVEHLVRHGYTNHVAAVLAPREWCERRGEARALRTGKKYCPEDFDRSLAAVIPMISASNGCFKVLRVTSLAGGAGPPELEAQVLASGRGGVALQGLQEVIDAAIARDTAAPA